MLRFIILSENRLLPRLAIDGGIVKNAGPRPLTSKSLVDGGQGSEHGGTRASCQHCAFLSGGAVQPPACNHPPPLIGARWPTARPGGINSTQRRACKVTQGRLRQILSQGTHTSSRAPGPTQVIAGCHAESPANLQTSIHGVRPNQLSGQGTMRKHASASWGSFGAGRCYRRGPIGWGQCYVAHSGVAAVEGGHAPRGPGAGGASIEKMVAGTAEPVV
jgi:hypothetical protein